MDSITQATLGAAVGEAVLGKKVGNKAFLWGAVAGTLPDLDVLAYPLMDEVAQLGWHRGPSHAFFYLTLAAPIIGWALSRLHKKGASWRGWTLLVYLAFVTHVLLDTFTVYGTQLFRPFSHLGVAFNNISIIDPLYTVPLLLSVLVALFLKRASLIRRRVVTIGLVLSTLYVAATFGIKAHVNSVAKSNFGHHGISAERYMTTPTLFNSLLWRITADVDDGYHVGYYSILDSDNDIAFAYLPRNDSLLSPLRGTDALERLLWFSQGYYVVTRNEQGDIQLADLRFGTLDAGQPASRRFVFEWTVRPTPPGRGSFSQKEMSVEDPGRVFANLWERVKGE